MNRKAAIKTLKDVVLLLLFFIILILAFIFYPVLVVITAIIVFIFGIINVLYRSHIIDAEEKEIHRKIFKRE